MENEFQPFATIYTTALHKSTVAGSIEVPCTGMTQNLTISTLPAKHLPRAQSTPSTQTKRSPRDTNMQISLSRCESRMKAHATNEVETMGMMCHGHDRCRAGDWMYADSAHSKPCVMRPLETDQPRSVSYELVEFIPRPASLETRARQKRMLIPLIYDSISNPLGRVRSVASGLHKGRQVEFHKARVPQGSTPRTFIYVTNTPYQVRHSSKATSQGLMASGVQVSTNKLNELTHSKSSTQSTLQEYHAEEFHNEAKDPVRLNRFSSNAASKERMVVTRAPETHLEHYILSSHDVRKEVELDQYRFGKASTDSVSSETETSRTILTTLKSSLSQACRLNAIVSPCLDSAMEASCDESAEFIRLKQHPQSHPESANATLDQSSFSDVDKRSNANCQNSQCSPAEFSGEAAHDKLLSAVLVDSLCGHLEGTAHSTDPRIQSVVMQKKLTVTSKTLELLLNEVGHLVSAKSKVKQKHDNWESSTGQQNIDGTPILSVPQGVCIQPKTTVNAWYSVHGQQIIRRAKRCTNPSATDRWIKSQSVAVCFTAVEHRRIRSLRRTAVPVINIALAHPHLGRSAEIIDGSGQLPFVDGRLMYRNKSDYHPMGASSSYSEVPRQRFSTSMITSIQYPLAIGENIVDRVGQVLHSPVSDFPLLNIEERDRYTPETDSSFCHNTSQTNPQYSAEQEKIEFLLNSILVMKRVEVEQSDHNRFHPVKRRLRDGVPDKCLKVPLSIVDLDEVVYAQLFDLNGGSNNFSEVKSMPLLICSSTRAQRECESAQHTSPITTSTLLKRKDEEFTLISQLDADVVCGTNVSPIGAVHSVIYNVSPRFTEPQKCAEPMQCVGKLRVQPSRTPDPCPFRAVQTNDIMLQIKDQNVLMYPISVSGVRSGRQWLRIRNPPLTRFHYHRPSSANTAYTTKYKYQGGDEWSYRSGMRAPTPFCVDTGDMNRCTTSDRREDVLYDMMMEYLRAHELYTIHGKKSIIPNRYISPLPPSIMINLSGWPREQYGMTIGHPDGIHLDAQDSRYFAEVSIRQQMSHKSQRGVRQWKTCAPFGRIFRRRAASSPQ
ncbi:unnamed protein product [Dicrocoelium dendriticum]|nr:unnamed protein product [Dicrocoelium dendriticum]